MIAGRVAFQAAMRAASADLLAAYAVAASIRLQVYPARPASLYPPTAFVDLIRESISYDGLRTRNVFAEVVVVHAEFDSKEAADQKDAFVDGFLDWVTDAVHGAGANTTVGVVETEDLPDYVPDWLPPEKQRTYYATRLTLEGLSLSG